MPVPVVVAAIWSWFLRVVVKTIGQKIFWFIVGQIGFVIVVTLTKDVVVELVEKLKTLIKTSNEGVLANIFKIEGLIWNAYSGIFESIDILFGKLETKLDDVLGIINTDYIEALLNKLNFAVWLTTLTSGIITSAADIIKDIVTKSVAPFLVAVTAIKGQVDQIVDAIQAVEDAFNGRLDLLFQDITAAIKFFDGSINDLKARVAALEAEVDSHNSRLVAGRAELSQLLNSGLGVSGEYVPLSHGQAIQLISSVNALADRAFGELSTTGYQIDWDSYRWVGGDFKREDYILDIDVPVLGALVEDLHSLKQDLAALPDDVAQAFSEKFPAILRGSLDQAIKAFLVLAILEAVTNKKEDIRAAFTEERAAFQQEEIERKETLRDDIAAITDDIKELEDKLIDSLPTEIKTSMEKAVERIKEGIVESSEEVLVNIDQFVPDVGEIDSIIEIFPQGLKANENPNSSDSVTFTIQDIYRLLCNNFYRSERIALILMLSTQDLNMNTGDLKDFLDGLWDKAND